MHLRPQCSDPQHLIGGPSPTISSQAQNKSKSKTTLMADFIISQYNFYVIILQLITSLIVFKLSDESFNDTAYKMLVLSHYTNTLTYAKYFILYPSDFIMWCCNVCLNTV